MMSMPRVFPVRHNRGLVFAVGCLVAGTGAIVTAASGHASALDVGVVRLGAWLVGPIAGALVLDRDPRHPVGLVLAASGLVPVVWLLAAFVENGSLPSVDVTATAGPLTVASTLALMTAILVVFPDADETVAVRPLFGAGVVGAAIVSLGFIGLARLGDPAGSWNWAVPVGGIVTVSVAAVAAFVYRARSAWRSSGAEARRQRWLLTLAVVAVAGSVAIGLTVGAGVGALVGYLGSGVHAGVVLGVAVLLLSDDLPEVGFSLARLTLLALTTAALALTYGLVLASLSWTQLPNRPAAAAAATGLVAVALLPAYAWARDRVAVLLYGTGQRPALVLAMLSRSLDTAGEAADTLRAACEAVAAAIRSPSVEVVQRVDDEAAPAPGSISVPLQAGGQFIGTLVAAPRRPGEPYSRRDVELVTTLAATLAQVARAAELASALERARRDLADERQDERRRLRRELHDGLGPLLSSLGLRLEALERSVSPEIRPRVVDLKDTVATSRGEVRRLVEGLAPTGTGRSIDLEQALTELVQGWGSAAAPQGLTFDLDIAGAVPPLADAVSLAIYRIAGEAITNVVRHARATSCVVRLRARPDGALVLEVCDDGIGIHDDSGGFGLRSMQERAASNGGTLDVVPLPDGGTRVRLRVPIASEELTG